MLVFFIRHGLTDWNIEKRFQGTFDIPLNSAGIHQAETAALRCKELKLERIYHSSLARAAQTAQIIAETANVPLVPHTGFNEVNLGLFQGLNHQEARERYPAEYAQYFSDRIHGVPPKGESLYQVQQRALKALSSIEEDAKGCERIAVVSHGALLKALLGAIAGIPLENYACYDVSNGSISVIESKEGARRLITLNAMAHFGDPYGEMSKTKLLI